VRKAGDLEFLDRKPRVDAFRFLQAQHIRPLIRGAPIEYVLQSRVDPVNVPSLPLSSGRNDIRYRVCGGEFRAILHKTHSLTRAREVHFGHPMNAWTPYRRKRFSGRRSPQAYCPLSYKTALSVKLWRHCLKAWAKLYFHAAGPTISVSRKADSSFLTLF
jgi:hypothetical protein